MIKDKKSPKIFILIIILICLTYIDVIYADYLFKRGEIRYTSKFVTNIFDAKDINGDKIIELACLLNNGEVGIGFFDKSFILQNFISISNDKRKINDIAIGDVFNDKSNVIIAVGGKNLYLFKLLEGNKIELIYQKVLYEKGEYGLEIKGDTQNWQRRKLDDLEARLVEVSDIDNDGKNEIILTKEDIWTLSDAPTYIFQVLKWTGKEFKTILLKDRNFGRGDEGGIYIEDVNFDGFNEYMVMNKVSGYKGNEVSIVHNGISGIGKLGSLRVIAVCGISGVEKEGKKVGVVQISKLNRDSFVGIRSKVESVILPEYFKKGGKYAPIFTSTPIENYKRFKFLDIDSDGYNELIVNCDNGFYIVKEVGLQLIGGQDTKKVLEEVIKKRYLEWVDKVDKLIEGRVNISDESLKEFIEKEMLSQQRWSEEERYFKAGDLLYLQKKYEEALVNYNELIKEKKDNIWVRNGYYRLGFYYYNNKQNEEAIRIINEMIKEYPNSESIGKGYLILGKIYQEKKEYLKAKENYYNAKERLSTKEITEDFNLNYAICLIEAGDREENKEGSKILEEMDKEWWENTPKVMDFKVQYYLGKAYENMKDIEKAVLWYKRYLGNTMRDAEFREYCKDRIDIIEKEMRRAEDKEMIGEEKPLIYLGEDYDTKGDWIGYYGNYSYVLCAMTGWSDRVGGEISPIFYHPRKMQKPLRNKSNEKALIYTVDIDDKNDATRYWLSEYKIGNKAGLFDPHTGLYRSSSWDDHGEIYPRNHAGPDLVVTLDIPKGDFFLSFYYCWGKRRYKVEIKDSNGKLFDNRNIGDFGGGAYYKYLVKGPIELNVRIYKGNSLNTTLSGIFLDKFKPLLEEVKQVEEYDYFCKEIKNEQLQFKLIKDLIFFVDKIDEEVKKVEDRELLLWMKWQIYRQLNNFEKMQTSFNQYAEELVRKIGLEETLKQLLPSDKLKLDLKDMKEGFLYQKGLLHLYKKHKSYNETVRKMIEVACDNYNPLYSKYFYTSYSRDIFKEALGILVKEEKGDELLKTLKEIIVGCNKIVLQGEVVKEIISQYGEDKITDIEQYILINSLKVTDHRAYWEIIMEYEKFINKYSNSSYIEQIWYDMLNFALSQGEKKESIRICEEYLRKYSNGKLRNVMKERLEDIKRLVRKGK